MEAHVDCGRQAAQSPLSVGAGRTGTQDADALQAIVESLHWKAPPPDTHREELLAYAAKSTKSSAAGGIDMWSVQAVQLIPRTQLQYLMRIYDMCVQCAQWPTLLLRVRTQLVPKRDATQGLLGIQEWRPLAISSVWVRLWAKWQLLQQTEMIKNLPPQLIGGIP